MNKIRKGDRVVITTGRDKGQQGTILQVLADDRVIVENLNLIKKHQKPNPQRGSAGGIIRKEAPVHVSNVALFNPATQKADRVRVTELDGGRKVRVFRSNSEQLDV